MINAGLFYVASVVIENTDAKQSDIFVAIFCMLFGAQQAGEAAGWGPDIGKATAAAEKVFGYIDQLSSINAIEMDKNDGGIDIRGVKGRIEFNNVWFRYPTRKQDFVLKGLNLVINPGESIALVGESGCGKSTFVNLMMRFYDPDSGNILLDGVDLREYNIH